MFRDGRNLRGLCAFVCAGNLLLACAAGAMPTNVILFIGDGMGVGQIAAAGMYAGAALSFESFPYQGQIATHSASSAITDSAAAATAMATGQKVNNGVISTALTGDGAELKTVLEYASDMGKSTGLVTTTSITHATPAAFAAHEPSRSNNAQIAQDYLTQTRPNVLFGGDGFMAGATAAGYAVVNDAAGLQALDTDSTTFVSGQFASGDMEYELDRESTTTQPHLSDMTAVALGILDNDPDGFFLMVEGGRIDHAAHANDIERTVQEVLEFSRAVETAMDWVAASAALDTLVLVTADHETGGLAVTAGNGVGVYPDVTWTTAGHTAADVPIYGWGTNGRLIALFMDNTDVYSIMTAGPDVIPTPRAMGLAAIGAGFVVLRRRRRGRGSAGRDASTGWPSARRKASSS